MGLDVLLPAWARSETHGLARPSTASVTDIALTIANTPFVVEGRTGYAITINGALPAPLLRLREGQNVRIAVTNHLQEDTSIHWPGMLLPFQMDGVPGVRPGTTFLRASEKALAQGGAEIRRIGRELRAEVRR